MTDDLDIYKTDITLDDGQTIHFMYDRDSDDLEIVFEKGRANCAVELTDNIVLRLDREKEKALSLILLNFSILAQPTDMGPKNFPLTGLADLPDDLRQTVVKIITSPPVNQFLKVSYFYPSPAERFPITYVERPPSLAMIA
ncbi:MAG TPA: DUF2283 domain-containing protein [Anaerolineae bacterium]|nr:DUF2283 domain-containing protein [Anaerolineae bacterium]